MKKLFLCLVVLFAFQICLLSQTPAELQKTGFTREQIEDNYIVGLNSDVAGLQVSAAYFLGEMKSERAVIPLMKMFSDENNAPGQRLMAAWSLLKIGDERGIYLIKCQSEDQNCDYLRCLCEYFYKDHNLKVHSSINPYENLK